MFVCVCVCTCVYVCGCVGRCVHMCVSVWVNTEDIETHIWKSYNWFSVKMVNGCWSFMEESVTSFDCGRITSHPLKRQPITSNIISQPKAVFPTDPLCFRASSDHKTMSKPHHLWDNNTTIIPYASTQVSEDGHFLHFYCYTNSRVWVSLWYIRQDQPLLWSKLVATFMLLIKLRINKATLKVR